MSAKNYFEFQTLSAVRPSRTGPPSRDTSDWEQPQAYLPEVDINSLDSLHINRTETTELWPITTGCKRTSVPHQTLLVTHWLSELTQILQTQWMQFLTHFCIQSSKYFWTVSTNSHVPLQKLLSEPSHNLCSPVFYLSKFRIIDSHQPKFSWRQIQSAHYWRWSNVTWLAQFISRHAKHTHQIVHVRCEVLTAVPIKIRVSWDVTPHQLV
jgi:hypothetical protein